MKITLMNGTKKTKKKMRKKNEALIMKNKIKLKMAPKKRMGVVRMRRSKKS